MFDYYDVPDVFTDRYNEVYKEYLKLIGEHLKSVGTLRPTEINRLEQMIKMGYNVNQINKELEKATGLNEKAITDFYMQIAGKSYSSFNGFFVARGLAQIPFESNKALTDIITAIGRQTMQDFSNLSNTTVMKQLYQECIDKAVIAVQSGYTDYNSAIREVVKKTAMQGNKVEYESGVRRDRETAARMNVLDGIRQINRTIAEHVGKEFNADGVELSAHYNCALDHLPYQGKQFTNEEYNNINENLKRPFTFWNCRHFPMPIIIGISKPAYSEEKLNDMRIQSESAVTINGKTMTRYDWTQQQRRLETEIRNWSRVKTMAKTTGDDVLRRRAQYEISKRKDIYKNISSQAELQMQPERMKTKLSYSPAEDNILTGAEKEAINRYISSDSYKINEKLRNGIKLTPDENNFVNHLDSALDKLPKYKGIVYRSVTADVMPDEKAFLSEHKVKDLHQYRSFTSTGLSVYDESFKYQFVILSKNGRDLTQFNESEKEILFKRDSWFIIKKREGNIFYMEEK